jgi:ACT domain-containing protein
MGVVMDRVVITVVGKDTVGIIARVCTFLAENSVNILDIAQTIVADFFKMMMVVDMNAAKLDFAAFCDGLDAIGADIGVTVKAQKEEIFDRMHRI